MKQTPQAKSALISACLSLSMLNATHGSVNTLLHMISMAPTPIDVHSPDERL